MSVTVPVPRHPGRMEGVTMDMAANAIARLTTLCVEADANVMVEDTSEGRLASVTAPRGGSILFTVNVHAGSGGLDLAILRDGERLRRNVPVDRKGREAWTRAIRVPGEPRPARSRAEAAFTLAIRSELSHHADELSVVDRDAFRTRLEEIVSAHPDEAGRLIAEALSERLADDVLRQVHDALKGVGARPHEGA